MVVAQPELEAEAAANERDEEDDDEADDSVHAKTEGAERAESEPVADDADLIDSRLAWQRLIVALLINTVGGVVKAGETIMEVVPAEDRLLITAKVKPADIAFLKPGQDARIRVTAYDSSIFGSLPGKVVRVGAGDPDRFT